MISMDRIDPRLAAMILLLYLLFLPGILWESGKEKMRNLAGMMSKRA